MLQCSDLMDIKVYQSKSDSPGLELLQMWIQLVSSYFMDFPKMESPCRVIWTSIRILYQSQRAICSCGVTYQGKSDSPGFALLSKCIESFGTSPHLSSPSREALALIVAVAMKNLSTWWQNARFLENYHHDPIHHHHEHRHRSHHQLKQIQRGGRAAESPTWPPQRCLTKSFLT